MWLITRKSVTVSGSSGKNLFSTQSVKAGWSATRWCWAGEGRLFPGSQFKGCVPLQRGVTCRTCCLRAAEVLSGHLFHSALQPAFLGLCCVPSTAGGAVVSETDEVPALRELIVCEETDNIRVNRYYMR